jgi:hypothetical protein
MHLTFWNVDLAQLFIAVCTGPYPVPGLQVLFRATLIISSHLRLGVRAGPSCDFNFSDQSKYLCPFIAFPMHATCPALFIVFDHPDIGRCTSISGHKPVSVELVSNVSRNFAIAIIRDWSFSILKRLNALEDFIAYSRLIASYLGQTSGLSLSETA